MCIRDRLRTVEQNNHVEIRNAVATFYDEMSSMGMNGESINLNINYLLFQFIHLASEQEMCIRDRRGTLAGMSLRKQIMVRYISIIRVMETDRSV